MKVKRVHILLVEDNQADARLATKLLTKSEIVGPEHVTVVHDGETALRLLRGEGEWSAHPMPSLVLLDLNIPKVSGAELLHEIRHDDALRDLPVIVLSSSIAPSDIEESARMWVNAYVRKPVDYEQYRELFEVLDGFWLQSCLIPS